MDNHSRLMIKSFHKFAFVVQVFVHTFAGVSFLFVFDVNERESPFDAISFLCKSCVWKRPGPFFEKTIPRTES